MELTTFTIKKIVYSKDFSHDPIEQPGDDYTVSNFEACFKDLMTKVQQGDASGVAAALNARYINPNPEEITSTEDTDKGLLVTHYQEHFVGPFIEFIFFPEPEKIRTLLKAAKENALVYNAILDAMPGKDFRNVNFKGLSHWLPGFDLSNTDLRHANITQAQLDQVKTYEGAALSEKSLIPYWVNNDRLQIENLLKDMKTYGETLEKSSGDAKPKGNAIVALADKLLGKMLDRTAKFNGAFQKDFVKVLLDKDTLNIVKQHRYFGLKYYIVNALALLTLGIAHGIHKAETGTMAFFAKTRSQEKLEGIERTVKRGLRAS